MKAFKRNWLRIILVIIASIFVNIIMHTFLSPITSENISLGQPSIFVKKDMLVPALLAWEVLAFSIFALVFLIIQDRLPGKRLMKGFLYGLSIGGLYFIGMFEVTLMFNSYAFADFLMGLPDFASFVLSGVLLGIAVGTDRIQKNRRQSILKVFIIALFYFVGRYFAYTVLHVNSAYNIRPEGTFLWTLGLGIWIGIIYFFLQSGSRGKSILLQGLFFGVITFGLNWIMNHVFLFTIIEFDFDILIRLGIDVLYVTIGVFICMMLCNERAKDISQTP